MELTERRVRMLGLELETMLRLQTPELRIDLSQDFWSHIGRQLAAVVHHGRCIVLRVYKTESTLLCFRAELLYLRFVSVCCNPCLKEFLVQRLQIFLLRENLLCLISELIHDHILSK